jgi:hypothetical protein
MKSLLFAAALMVGGTALAQADMGAQTAPAGGETVAPSNAAPERDARGIPVISDAATAPPGVNQPFVVPPGAQVVVNPNQAAAFATQPSTGVAPPCSRTVTDHCVQAYEHGGRPARHRRRR